MKQKLLAMAVVAAIGGVASGAVNAAASASGSLSGFTIQLYDLDPTDAIPASVVFTESEGSYVSSYEYSTTPSSYDNQTAFSGTVFGPATIATAGPLSSSSATIAGTSITTAANVVGGDYSYAAGFALLGDGSAASTFTLSADTLMVIRAISSLAASATSGTDYAGATAYLQLNGSGANGSQSAYSSFQTLAGAYYGYPGSTTAGGGMAVSFVNASATDSATGSFYGYVESWAQSYEPTSTVPEPTNMALLVSGLGALGILVRRRARQD